MSQMHDIYFTFRMWYALSPNLAAMSHSGSKGRKQHASAVRKVTGRKAVKVHLKDNHLHDILENV
jgi:hypothetical protein